MGYEEPTSYRSNSLFKTPNIDRMAKEGMRFTDAHSSAASCTPSHYGFLTGRYPHRIGQFGVLSIFSPPLIPKTRLTIASYLKQNGYITACIGKWHLGMNWGRPKTKGKNKTKDEFKIGEKMTGGPNAIGLYAQGHLCIRIFRPGSAPRRISDRNDSCAVYVRPRVQQSFAKHKLGRRIGAVRFVIYASR